MALQLSEKDKIILTLSPISSKKDGRQLKKMLKSGIDPNSSINLEGDPVLKHFIDRNDITAVQTLIEFGSNVNFKNKSGQTVYMTNLRINGNILNILTAAGADLNATDNFGKTALMYAAEEGYSEIENYIRLGVDVKKQDNEGKSVIFYAKGDENKVSLLKSAGANINAQDKTGSTALFHLKYPHNIEQFLELGADPNIKNNNGETYLIWTVKYCLLEKHYIVDIIKILFKNEADFYSKDNQDHDFYYYLVNGELDLRKDREAKLLKELGLKSDSFWIRIKTKEKCTECAQEVPLNGPYQQLKCNFCQTVFKIGQSLIKALPFVHKKAEPACPFCDEVFDKSLIESIIEGEISCAKCNKQSYIYPTPEWFKLVEIQGVKPDTIISSSGKEEIHKEEKQSAQPVAVRCISCSAAMSVNVETPRNATCEHCGVVQYLPDPLWLSLHPVKKMMKWYVKFS